MIPVGNQVSSARRTKGFLYLHKKQIYCFWCKKRMWWNGNGSFADILAWCLCGAMSGCGSRSKQTLNMLFPKLRDFYYLSLKITIYCTRDNHNYVPLDQELLIFKQMLSYCTKTLWRGTRFYTSVSFISLFSFFLHQVTYFLSFANMTDYSQCSEC